MHIRKRYKILGIAVTFMVIAAGGIWLGYRFVQQAQVKQLQSQVSTEGLPQYKESDLAPFNGDDLSKPIYIGFNGLVYDVSAGADYYKTDGSYHYLAGRDSSAELNEIGGDIIARKYPVVGVLVP